MPETPYNSCKEAINRLYEKCGPNPTPSCAEGLGIYLEKKGGTCECKVSGYTVPYFAALKDGSTVPQCVYTRLQGCVSRPEN